MRLRSLLFVPGDRPERMEKALTSGADALILDLEDSVSTERKAFARDAIRTFLLQGGEDGPKRMVRINPLDSVHNAADLDAISGASPAAIMLPKAEGEQSIIALRKLYAQRNLLGVPVLPIATETAAAMFHLGSYANVGNSLIGLTWGAEDLPAAIGAATSREADGSYTAPYQVARSLTLFAAHAAGVAAIDTVYPDFRDLDGLAAYAARARRDGFNGMMAIHPHQVEPINRAFTPSEEEVAHAQAVIDLFAANPRAGALALNGKMIDAPHLKQAHRVLAMLGAAD